MGTQNQYRNQDRSRYLRRRRRRKMSSRFSLAIAIALLTFALLISSLSMARMVFTAGDRAVPSPSPTALLVANDSPVEVAPVEVASAIAFLDGDRLSLNGKTFSGAWMQWQDGDETRTGLSDMAAEAILGIELLDTQNPNIQPIQWFGISQPLSVQFTEAYRYLDITDILAAANCQVQTQDSILSIDFSPPQINNIEKSDRGEGGRITISLDRPTFWQVSQNPTQGVVMLEGSNIAEFPLNGIENNNNVQNNVQNSPLFSQLFPSRKTEPAKLNAKIEPGELRTKIQVDLPTGNQLQVTSTASPPQLIVDVRPDALAERNIVVAPGMFWQRRYVPSDDTRFPVTSLTFNPRDPNIALRPIWGNPRSMQGTEPLVTMGRQWQAFAAINGGFFNRNNRLPLGAIRRDGKWFSGPILNRGAIAWDDAGNVAIGRLYLRETLVTSTRQRLFVLFLNSGYLQAGIARYTSEWGAQYTPLTDNETIVLVEGDRVTQQFSGGKAGQSAVTIPTEGYLLTIRGGSASPGDLAVGTRVSLESETVPPNFGNYPQIMGAGPLLLQNGQFVLNPSEEKFSNAFNGQAASRSLIGITRAGTLIIAAIHNRPGGRGPTLNELARLALRLGMMDALNLDGGSSTSFYLGGQLVDRSAVTAARVHNGIGIYLKSANSR